MSTSTTPVLGLEPESTLQGLLQSFAMIIFSEIGDKTFLIAAILAMRHPRLAVFAGAFGALVAMSVLSAALGHILPALIPKKWTQAAAGVLFGVFGAKMLQEARGMEAGSGKIREEMREAEEEIEEDEAGVEGEDIPLEAVEEGGRPIANGHGHRRQNSLGQAKAAAHGPTKALAEGARNFCSLVLGPVFVQAFVLTFLGEWGDRSQIATIALGAAHNVYLVTIGTIVGHSLCTALAVVGGRYVSTKISVKHVTFGGAILFLIFAVIYLYEAFASAADPDDIIPVETDALDHFRVR